VETQDQLKQGATFNTPAGDQVAFSLEKSGMFGALELHGLRDGIPIRGTGADPNTKIGGARGVLWFFGGLQLVIGLAVMFFAGGNADLDILSGVWLDGIVLLGFALFSLMGGWMALVAFGGAILYYIAGFVLLIGSGVNPTSGIFVRILVIWIMWRGIQGVRQLQDSEKAKRG
jgi:hypothetical protein